MNSGVYIIKNIISGHMYVGASSQLTRRRKDHFAELRRGTHYNAFLQSSYNKHEGKGFVFGIVEYCSEDKLEELEQYYIDKYWNTRLYNGRKKANIRRPVKEERELQSKIKELKKRPLLQYSSDGTFYKEWDSCLAACKVYGNGVRSCLKGTLIACKDYFFFYKKTFKSEDLDIKLRKYRLDRTSRQVWKYDLQGNIVFKYDSITSCAEKEDRGNLKNISRTCLGQRKTFKGHIYKYIDNDIKGENDNGGNDIINVNLSEQGVL